MAGDDISTPNARKISPCRSTQSNELKEKILRNWNHVLFCSIYCINTSLGDCRCYDFDRQSAAIIGRFLGRRRGTTCDILPPRSAHQLMFRRRNMHSSECCHYVIELLPFAKIQFSGLFSPVFCDIDLKFGIWIYLNIIVQIKFDFCCVWPTFTWVITLC